MDSALLAAAVASGGKIVEPVVLPDGSRLLVMPYGGRVLGLFPPGDDENFYWVNPVLRDPTAARAFYASSAWQNLGGERTWIGPEIDYFFPRYPDLGAYRPPPPLDGSDYTFAGGALRFSQEFTVRSVRDEAPIGLTLTKSIRPAPNPHRREGVGEDAGALRYAGYTLATKLEWATKPAGSARVGIWNLIQLPHGGEMVIPVSGLPEPILFFGEIPTGHLRLARGLARHRMAARGDHKIGFRAPGLAGRMGYLYRTRDEAQLVIRNFAVAPSGAYPDVPATGVHPTGCCAESCNVSNDTLGSFSELEYHAPAIGAQDRASEDVSQVWAYRGEPKAIAGVAERLLGLPEDAAWA
jgi:hypothetical protein